MFRGKSGIDHELELDDGASPRSSSSAATCRARNCFSTGRGRIADRRVVRRRERVPEGDDRARISRRRISGHGPAPCWRPSCCATRHADTPSPTKKHIVAVVEQVAKQLGNTKAVCRKCYIHPAVIRCVSRRRDREGGGVRPRACRTGGREVDAVRDCRARAAAATRRAKSRLEIV